MARVVPVRHSWVPSARRPTKTVARFMEQLRIPSRLAHRQKIMARLHLGITSRLQGKRYHCGGGGGGGGTTLERVVARGI